jgi:glycosyltransferase involved in cell wall biosynthesis
MSISIFLSTVSDEFRDYRDRLRGDLTRHNVEVKVQEDFKGLGGDTLDKLDVYIAHCDAVVHLVGEMTGSAPGERDVQALLRKHDRLRAALPPLDAALGRGEAVSYTQWEAWLALYHGKKLLIAKAEPAAPRRSAFAATDHSRAAQAAHLARLEVVGRYPDCRFESAADLAQHIAYTAILDLLVADHARDVAAARVNPAVKTNGAPGESNGRAENAEPLRRSLAELLVHPPPRGSNTPLEFPPPGTAATLANLDGGGRRDRKETVGIGLEASSVAAARPPGDRSRCHDTGGRSMQADPMNARPEPAPGAPLAIVLLATGWGPQHGGINSFNHDFAGGLARALGEHGKVFCAVPTPAREADAKAVAEAGQAGVTLLSMTGTTTSDRFDPNWTAAIHLRLQRDHGVAAVFCWVGHDVISGDAAVHAAREFGGKCALIMHMSYRRYQTVKTGDAADADRKSREQQALFSNPDIQAFAVGPLLLEACRDWSPGTPVMLVPGFAPIGAPRPPASGLVAITFGRLDQREDRIKQGRLAADGFARATKDDETSPIPSSRLKNGILFLLGLSADIDGEAGEIRKNANKIADRIININPLAYDTDRAAVLRRLQTASLALMLSWHEGFGLTGWEAIAAELPLVASENSGLYKLVREELGDSGTALLHHIDVKGSMGEAGEPNYHGDDLAGVSLAIRKIAHDLQNCQNNAKELKRRLTEKLGCTWEKAGEQFLAGLADPSRPKESPAAERERQQRERWKAERTAKLEADILNLLKSSAALMTKLEDHRPPDADPGSPAPSAADERARRIFDLLMSVSPFEDALDWLLRVHRDLGIGDNAAKATLAEISKRLIPWLYIVSHPHPEEIAALVPTDLGDVLPLSLGRHSFAELVAAGLEARAADYVGAPGARQQQGSRSISDPPLEGPDADIEEKIRRKLLTEAEGLPEFAHASPAEQDRAINRALRFFQDGQDPKRYYFTFFAGDYDKALLERIAGRYQPLAVIRLSKDWRDTHHAWSLIISDLLGHRI